jgi:hypothetical protein
MRGTPVRVGVRRVRLSMPDFIGGWWESSRMKSVSRATPTRVILAAVETSRKRRAPEVVNPS